MANAIPSTEPSVPTVLCLHCSAPVSREGRITREYCSDECYRERKKILRKDTHSPKCVMCGNEYVRNSNRQKYCEDCKVARTREYTSQYNEINRDIVIIKRREHMKLARDADPEKFRARNRKYWADNAEDIKARRTTDDARKKSAARVMARYRSDPSFSLHARMASGVYAALRDKKSGRKWESIVGYTLEDLRSHIERQFTKGMSWDNMGDWHIDHIVPRASFSYANDNDPEFKACWAITNLRPLWANDNIRKGAKLEYLI